MVRVICTDDEACQLASRAVGHRKNCPARATDAEKALAAQPETAAKIEDFLNHPETGVLIERAGWAPPSGVIYPEALGGFTIQDELPDFQIKRGGIKHPRFRVETLVQSAKKRFMRRRTWNLHVRYWDAEKGRHANHIMEGFPSESLANNAAEIIKFTMMTMNTQYHADMNRRA